MVALAESWRRFYPDDEVLCYGSADGIEAKLIPQFKLPFQPLPARPLFDNGTVSYLRSGVSAVRGMLAGRRHMRQHKLDALICWGGYTSVGAGLAAASLDCPLIVFEANAVPGRANTLLTRFANMKLITMPELLQNKAWQDARVTELPLRLNTGKTQRASGTGPARLMITGGTFGSPLLNKHSPALVAELARQHQALDIYHQAGIGMEAGVRNAYTDAGVAATVVGFDLELTERWSWADAVLCAGGAGTLAEATVSGTPTLAIPLAAASDDHQLANVKSMAARHDISWVLERDWDTSVIAHQMLTLLRQPRHYPANNDTTEAIIHAIRTLGVRS
jgi:UDP-N-acetylglucosamine--N-acetylmuramyl-(pentapeptide) pyrophosphoryl-undecaprenol N-acetylglucosamine transferase